MPDQRGVGGQLHIMTIDITHDPLFVRLWLPAWSRGKEFPLSGLVPIVIVFRGMDISGKVSGTKFCKIEAGGGGHWLCALSR